MIVYDITNRKHSFSRLNPMRTKVANRILDGYIVVNCIQIFGTATRLINGSRLFVEDNAVRKRARRISSRYHTNETRHVHTMYG